MEARRRIRDCVCGLLGPVDRKNSRQFAEYTGHATPDGLQRLPSRGQEMRTRSATTSKHASAYVAEPDGALIVGDVGFVRGHPGLQGWYSGTSSITGITCRRTPFRLRIATTWPWRYQLGSAFAHLAFLPRPAT